MPSQNGGAPAPVGIIRERSGDGLSAWRAHTPGGAGRPRSRPASREKPHLRPLTLAQSAGVDRQVVEGRPYTPRAVVPDGLESTQDDGLQSSPVGQRPPGRPTVWTPSHRPSAARMPLRWQPGCAAESDDGSSLQRLQIAIRLPAGGTIEAGLRANGRPRPHKHEDAPGLWNRRADRRGRWEARPLRVSSCRTQARLHRGSLLSKVAA